MWILQQYLNELSRLLQFLAARLIQGSLSLHHPLRRSVLGRSLVSK